MRLNEASKANHEQEVELVIFGSDHPHVEGLADPLSYHGELAGLPEEDQAKIMGGNMMRLMGLAV
jgi:predicted TIM-barrel fold metal-dependent hydrolase